MPPKRILNKNSSKPSRPPVPVQTNNEEIDLDAELKFDREVLWCITQFEKLIKSGKINDAKKHESMKAITTLKKSTVPKIQKIQLMKQYFKDYKSKMAKDESVAVQQENVQFESQAKLNGLFVKKKTVDSKPNEELTKPNCFLFNFQSEKNDSDDHDSLSKDVIEKLAVK